MRKISVVVGSLCFGLLLSISPSVASATSAPFLPSPHEVERRAAERISLNERVRIIGALTFASWTDQHPKGHALTVKVTSFDFLDVDYEGRPRYGARMTVQNFAPDDSVQIYPEIRCMNSQADANTWADSTLDPSLPPRSQASGMVVLDLPKGMTLSTCKKPVLWLQPASSYSLPTGSKWAKETGLAWAAYLPLTPNMLRIPTSPSAAPTP